MAVRVCRDCGEEFTTKSSRALSCPSCKAESNVCPDCGAWKKSTSKHCNDCGQHAPRPGTAAKMTVVMKERWRDPEYRERMKGFIGENHCAWNPETDHSMYLPRTSESRERRANLLRDGYCSRCGMTNNDSLERWGASLSLHHKDGNHQNDIDENIETLCRVCHPVAHSELRKNMHTIMETV